MMDSSQQYPPVPQPANVNYAPSGQPQRSRRNLWIILGVVGVGLCLCSVVCMVTVGAGLIKIAAERAPIEDVLNTFMAHMVEKDLERAYGLYSPRAQRQVTKSDLNKMVTGNSYYLFEGYQKLTVQRVNLKAAVNSNPDMAQGTVAEVNGSISYHGGFTGQFTAVLEKVDGTWKLHSINITVPPDKFK